MWWPIPARSQLEALRLQPSMADAHNNLGLIAVADASLSSTATQSEFWTRTRRPDRFDVTNRYLEPRVSLSWDPRGDGRTRRETALQSGGSDVAWLASTLGDPAEVFLARSFVCHIELSLQLYPEARVPHRVVPANACGSYFLMNFFLVLSNPRSTFLLSKCQTREPDR